jgi:divalent metal cation (Fe/Co/Zn/Cd) transporter
MDENLFEDLIQKIRDVSIKVPGVAGTEKCYIRKAGMQYHVDLHALVAANITVRQGHDIAHALKDTLLKELPQLGNILIHIEPKD